MFYDTIREYEFEQALRDEERLTDWDEREVKNRTLDDADDWEANCLSEEAHKRMLERASKEHEEAMKAIERWYKK